MSNDFPPFLGVRVDIYLFPLTFSLNLSSFACVSAGWQILRSEASMYDAKGDRAGLLGECHRHGREGEFHLSVRSTKLGLDITLFTNLGGV